MQRMSVDTAPNPTMMRVIASLSREIWQGAHVVGQELAQEVVQGVQGAGRNLMDVLFVDLRDTGRMNVQR